MGTYDIDFPVLVEQLLPVRLRKSKTLRWLRCLIVPVIELHNLFKASRIADLYKLAHNSQVVYLQAVLNDVFDTVSRRIFITDSAFTDSLFIYLVPENRPLWLGLVAEEGTTRYPDPQYLYTRTEAIAAGYCFVIHIPASISFDMNYLRAVTDKYRLPGKSNYAVVLF